MFLFVILWRGPPAGGNQVLPIGFAIFSLGFSMIMREMGAPDGIIGKTLSSFTTSATTTQGPWS